MARSTILMAVLILLLSTFQNGMAKCNHNIICPVVPGEKEINCYANVIEVYESNPQQVVDRVDRYVAHGATVVSKVSSSGDSYYYLLRDPFGNHWKIATQNLAPPPS